MRPLASATLFLLAAVRAGAVDTNETVIRPEEYPRALRNPLKGFRPRRRDGSHEWGTLCRVYMKWNEIENGEADGVGRIRAASDRLWRGVERHNVKVIPRVYLHWPPDRNYWPADLETGDYSSPRFKRRLVRLVERLGECWDDDPRVAWVQMGLIGKWGEHHSPAPDAAMQKLLGDAFTKAFGVQGIRLRYLLGFMGALAADEEARWGDREARGPMEDRADGRRGRLQLGQIQDPARRQPHRHPRRPRAQELPCRLDQAAAL
ncbi:MAG: hypothetical protein ACYSU0_19960 [Planctomycetota bacterium]|jgi:hypothetical protein